MNKATFAVMVIAALCLAGCARTITMKPGRDAYYQVTSQFVPAQATGSHSQAATLITSGSTGSVERTDTVTAP